MPDFLQIYIDHILDQFEKYGPNVAKALTFILIGIILSTVIYKIVLYLFRKFKINQIIDKFQATSNLEDKKGIFFANMTPDELSPAQKEEMKFSKQIRPTNLKIDEITAKSASGYIFILFFRQAIVILGISEVEIFLTNLVNYLPSLFVGLLIGYFGFDFANFVYSITYHALNLTKQETANMLAMLAKIVVMFFTFMLVLDQVKIVDKLIINACLIGFISTFSLAFGLAFGLGGKEFARDLIESFKKK